MRRSSWPGKERKASNYAFKNWRTRQNAGWKEGLGHWCWWMFPRMGPVRIEASWKTKRTSANAMTECLCLLGLPYSQIEFHLMTWSLHHFFDAWGRCPPYKLRWNARGTRYYGIDLLFTGFSTMVQRCRDISMIFLHFWMWHFWTILSQKYCIFVCRGNIDPSWTITWVMWTGGVACHEGGTAEICPGKCFACCEIHPPFVTFKTQSQLFFETRCAAWDARRPARCQYKLSPKEGRIWENSAVKVPFWCRWVGRGGEVGRLSPKPLGTCFHQDKSKIKTCTLPRQPIATWKRHPSSNLKEAEEEKAKRDSKGDTALGSKAGIKAIPRKNTPQVSIASTFLVAHGYMLSSHSKNHMKKTFTKGRSRMVFNGISHDCVVPCCLNLRANCAPVRRSSSASVVSWSVNHGGWGCTSSKGQVPGNILIMYWFMYLYGGASFFYPGCSLALTCDMQPWFAGGVRLYQPILLFRSL